MAALSPPPPPELLKIGKEASLHPRLASLDLEELAEGQRSHPPSLSIFK